MTGQPGENRLQRLEKFLDSQISGWRKHVITDLKQSKITVGYSNCIDADSFSKYSILLAGPWVKSQYVLADAATETGKQAAKQLKSII